ncbi:MAG TPA: FecR domain-containing protein [Stellaceae bacterium]|nr:FecR domain-containing protein [Stellaceae bacterium]
MSRMPGRALQTLALCLLCLCSRPAEAGSLAGSVVGVVGQAFVDRSGQRSGLRLGDPVFVDDAFTVPAGAKLKLRMNDGSVLSLAENTTLRIDIYVLNSYGQRQSAVMSLGGGLIRAITAPGSQPSLFEVNTAVGTSGARSTDWFSGVLTASPPPGSRLSGTPPGSAYVVVLSGTVALTSRATGRSVLIQPSYGSEVVPGQDPHPPVLHTQAELDRLTARTEVR